MEPRDLPTLLSAHPLFARLTTAERAEIARRTVSRRYPRNAIIFAEGDPATALHLVGHGVVRILKRSLGGREQTLLFADPGETFAEVPLFDGGPYPASAEAFTDARVFALPAVALRHLLHTVPTFAETALAIFAARNRHLTEIVEDLAFRPVIGRVARILLTETHEQTQTQMAAMAGSAREMVNRALHTLEREGVIRIEDGNFFILNHARLAAIADDM